MKTLTLKTDESFFERVGVLAQRLHISKSELIRRAITDYETSLARKEMQQQMQKASMRVREESARVNREFEETLLDGLEDA